MHNTTTISHSANICTLINTFVAKPQRQQGIIDSLRRFTLRRYIRFRQHDARRQPLPDDRARADRHLRHTLAAVERRFRRSNNSNARFIGFEQQLSPTWRLSEHVAITFAYVHFLAGDFVVRGGGRDEDVGMTEVNFRF